MDEKIRHHGGGFEMKYKVIRIKLETYLDLRRRFRARYKESASDYFERLSIVLEGGKKI